MGEVILFKKAAKLRSGRRIGEADCAILFFVGVQRVRLVEASATAGESKVSVARSPKRGKRRRETKTAV